VPVVFNVGLYPMDDMPGYAPTGKLLAAFDEKRVGSQRKGKHVSVRLLLRWNQSQFQGQPDHANQLETP